MKQARGGKWRRVSKLVLSAGAVLAIASAAGCSSGPAATAGTGPEGGASASLAGANGAAASPPLTIAGARAAFAAYVAASDRAAQSGDRALALSVLSGGARDTADTAFSIARAAGVKPPYTRYAYGAPAFYLTSAQGAGGPQFFVASATRTPVPGTVPMGPSAQDVAAGVPLPAAGRVLLLFEQSAAGRPWELASASQLAPGQAVPALATDRRGYVTLAKFNSPSAGSPLVIPAVAPGLQAAVVDDGPASAAGRYVAGGPLTTGLYARARTSARGIAAPPGDVYQWVLEGSSYGRLALATADGGMLVFYTMYLNNTVETRSALSQAIPVTSGPPITVPAYLRPLLPPAQWSPRKRLQTQDILSFAAVDPPAAAKAGQVKVIAVGGGLHTVTAS
ncbi:MAG TPA: hypothetical protein VH478_26730 [Trebonia sp.]|nr:hypothetical protein [Trebonia sp.]